jgi:hypothetical protein
MRRGDMADAIAVLKSARGAMRALGTSEAEVRKEPK